MTMSDNLWKLLVFSYLSLSFIVSGLGLLWLLNGGLTTGWNGSDWTVIREYAFYIAAGSMGGTLYALRLFHQFYNTPLAPRFVYWYFMRPYLCGGTAMMTVILLNSGIMLLEVGDSMLARTGLSFLVGFGYGKFMEKLTYLTEALFNGNSQTAGTAGTTGTTGTANAKESKEGTADNGTTDRQEAMFAFSKADGNAKDASIISDKK
jgi:hypothetical protein